AAPTLILEDSIEAPVGVGAGDLVHGGAGDASELAQARPDPALEQVALRTRGGSLDAPACPLPGHVHVMGQGDGEAGAAPARRLDSQAMTEPLERRIERVEA